MSAGRGDDEAVSTGKGVKRNMEFGPVLSQAEIDHVVEKVKGMGRVLQQEEIDRLYSRGMAGRLSLAGLKGADGELNPAEVERLLREINA